MPSVPKAPGAKTPNKETSGPKSLKAPKAAKVSIPNPKLSLPRAPKMPKGARPPRLGK